MNLLTEVLLLPSYLHMFKPHSGTYRTIIKVGLKARLHWYTDIVLGAWLFIEHRKWGLL